MKLSKNGCLFVEKFEGFRAKTYRCSASVLTIGIGFTNRSKSFSKYWKKKKGRNLKANDRISRQESLEILPMVADAEYGQAVKKNIGNHLKQHEYDAATSMCFNCGPGATNWKWGKALKAGNVKRAAALLKNTAVTARGKRLRGLVRRRKAEAHLLLTGRYGVKNSVRDITKPLRESTMLKFGSRGQKVKELQEKLVKLEFYKGMVDGTFGLHTKQAVIEFQHSVKLQADGIVGNDTRDALNIKLKAENAPAVAVAAGAVIAAVAPITISWWDQITIFIGGLV